MSKKQLIPLALICVVLLALLAVKKLSERPVKLEDQLKLVAMAPSGFLASEVEKFELYRGEKKAEKVTLLKKDDGWIVQTGFDAPGRKKKIDDFLEKVKKLQGQAREPGPLDSYGLTDQNALHIAVYRKNEKEPAYHVLSGKEAGHNRRFVRRAGEEAVYIVDLNIASELGIWGDDAKAPEADHWIDTTALDLDKNKIAKVTLSTPEKSLVLEKREKPSKEEEKKEGEGEKPKKKEYEWVLAEGPTDMKLKKEGVDGILRVLDSLSATGVDDPATKKDVGLETPGYRCEVVMDGGDTHVLVAAKAGPDASGYAMLEGRDVLYKIANYRFDDLFVEGSRLFDLPKIGGKDEDVTVITLTYGKGEIQLKRNENGQWIIVSPVTGLQFKEPEADKVANALVEWAPSDYADGTDPAALGLAAPDRTVTFVMKDGKKHTMAVGAESAVVKGRFTALDGGKRPWITEKNDFEKIFPKPRTFWEMDVARIQDEDILEVKVKRDDLDYVLTRKGKENWLLTTRGATIAPDHEEVGRFLDRFSPFRATDVVLEKKPFTRDVWARVEVNTKKDKGLTLSFGSEKEGDCEMQMAGTPAIMLVGRYTAENATPPLKDFFKLTVLDVSRDDMKKITVKRKTDPLEAAKDGDAWKVSAAGKELAAEKEKLSRFIGRYAYLRADGVAVGQPALLKGADTTVEILKKDDSVVTLTFGAEKDGMVALRKDKDQLIYLLKKDEVARLMPAPADLLPARKPEATQTEEKAEKKPDAVK